MFVQSKQLTICKHVYVYIHSYVSAAVADALVAILKIFSKKSKVCKSDLYPQQNKNIQVRVVVHGVRRGT